VGLLIRIRCHLPEQYYEQPGRHHRKSTLIQLSRHLSLSCMVWWKKRGRTHESTCTKCQQGHNYPKPQDEPPYIQTKIGSLALLDIPAGRQTFRCKQSSERALAGIPYQDARYPNQHRKSQASYRLQTCKTKVGSIKGTGG